MDADGDITRAVRGVVGPDCPIITVHDMHCNIGPDMVDSATALIVMETYPHTDMAERALEGANMIVRTIAGEIQPTCGWCSIPIFWNAARMITAEQPMSGATTRYPNASNSRVAALAISVSPHVQKQSGSSRTTGDPASPARDRIQG